MRADAMMPTTEAGRPAVFEVALPQAAPLRVLGAKGCRIACPCGAVLLTAYGEHADHQLSAGGMYTAPNNGLLLIESLGRHSRLLFEFDLPPLLRLCRALGWPERYAPHRGIRHMARIGATRAT